MLQFDGGSFMLQIDLHLAGFGMFGNIIQRFLADPVEGHLHFGGQDALSRSRLR